MRHYFQLKDSTPKSEEFIELFQRRLEELVHADFLPPGMAIAIMANLNFHGEDMPCSVFRRLRYEMGWETPEDPVILAESLKRIAGEKVVIDKTERTKVGDFQLQYNFVRGFRPKRGARKSDIPLDLPFDPEGFHYGREVVGPEVFHSLKYDNDLTVDFVFNRYPFAPYHFLWVPNRKEGGHNQYLDPEKDQYLIESAWNLVAREGFGSGIRLCYNSNGAHASVNHFHLQGFFLTQDWSPPFESIFENERVPNGGKVTVKEAVYKRDRSGTIDCYFKGARWIAAHEAIDGLKEFLNEMNRRYQRGEKIAFNFCMTPGGIACFPRKHQGDEGYFSLLQRAPFTTGYAFFEMLGEIISPIPYNEIPNNDGIEKQIKQLYQALSIDNSAE